MSIISSTGRAVNKTCRVADQFDRALVRVAREESGPARRTETEMARIGVGGVLLRGNQILLGRRSADRTLYPGVWDTVGGHWIEGETHEQTLIRELGEELGVLPLEYRLLAVVADPRPD